MAVSVVLGHRIALELGLGGGPSIPTIAFGCMTTGLVLLVALRLGALRMGALRRSRSGVALRPGVLAAAWLVCLGHGLSVGADQGTTKWPVVRSPPPHAVVELEVLDASTPGPTCEVRTRPVGHRVLARTRLSGSICPLSAGRRIRVRLADIHVLEGPAWPGGPHPRDLAHWDGAHVAIEVERAWLAPHDDATWSWSRAVAGLRHSAYDDARGRDDVGFVVASALGVRSALSPLRRSELRRAGLGHLIAVSGLHVALAAWLVFHVAMRFAAVAARGFAVAVVVSWIPVVAYAALTGGSAPAARAAAMLVVFGLGELLGRPVHGLNVLFAVGAAMLWIQPDWATHAGFQLSWVAMIALVSAPPGTGALGATWRVSWALLPLSILYFGQTQTHGLLANAIALPVFTLWVLPLGLFGGCLQPWLGPSAWTPAAWGAQLIVDVAALVDRLPTLSVAATASIAGAFLVLRFVARLDPPGPRRRALARLVHRGVAPPTLACLGVLAVTAWVHVQPRAEPASWYATGSARYPTIIGRSDPGFCIGNPDSAGERWPALLRELGVQGVAAIVEDGQDAQGPHVDALRAALEREGMWRPGPSETCRFPPRAEVAALLKRCRFMVGEGPVLVAGSDSPEGPRCWWRGAWSLMR